MRVYGCFLTSSVLLLSLTAVVTETCKVPLIDPPHLLVQYGDPAWANCSTTDQPDMMGWESPVGEIHLSGVTHLIWTLESLTTWAVGKGIQCYTMSDSGSYCASKLNITIYKPPDRVSIDALQDVDDLAEGQPLQLLCVAVNIAPASHVKVAWFKGQEQLRGIPSTDFTVHGDQNENVTVTQTLNLTASREDNGAQYRCEAKLELEGLQPHPVKTSQPLAISVFFAPAINCPSEVQVRENDRLPNCTAEGNPYPEFTWFKGHQQVDPQATLSRVDGGRYTVIARNRIGIVNQTVDVEIWFGPEINCPTKAQVKEHDRLPRCSAMGNPPPEVIWFKGHRVDPLSPLSRIYGGQYTVIAKNSVGAVNQTVGIEILYSPMITCPQTLEVRENEALNGCTVEGNPPPELTWYKGDKKGLKGVKVDPISKLGKMDEGQYTLFAESKPFSSVHRSVEVVIISKGNNISMSGGCVLLVVLFSHIFH